MSCFSRSLRHLRGIIQCFFERLLLEISEVLDAITSTVGELALLLSMISIGNMRYTSASLSICA